MKGRNFEIFTWPQIFLVSVCFAQVVAVELRSFVSSIDSYITDRIGYTLLEDALTVSLSQFSPDSESMVNAIEGDISTKIDEYLRIVTRLKTALETDITNGDLLTTRNCCDKDEYQVGYM